MKNLLYISEQEKKNIMKMHGILNEQDTGEPDGWIPELKCVWGHPEAVKEKFGDSFRFRIKDYDYYNNGRRYDPNTDKTEEYDCYDIEPAKQQVNQKYIDNGKEDQDYRYLKWGENWFARNKTKNGSVFNLSKKAENNSAFKKSINNLNAANEKKDGKKLEVDSSN